ncbi:LpxI family protein [Desulfonatronovibrio magnus]|uniref:LpxI family protein n=1 Tax=Desulfonatronovibrio magnus TaxID=698827 RepID=UPI0005EB2D55|nr:UDP-2,3-diacylglucosamine diphosphatase LpxI [Desulfonatronovibrio magnus]
MPKDNTLGIVAGGGQFPFIVAKGALDKGMRVAVIGFDNDTDPAISELAHAMKWIKLGQLGRLISFMRDQHVREIVFAGPVNKPRALSLRPDMKALKLLFKLSSRNDNALLTAVINELEAEGFKVVSALQYTPQLQAPAGNLTKRKPDDREWEDIHFGWPIVRQIGALDIGQCIVVREKAVIAVEAIEGTDATILRAGSLIKEGFTVIKTFKPDQDNRIDLPAMGLATIETMIKAGARCLAYEAGKSLFFDRDKAARLADKHKITIVGLAEDFKPL